MKKTIALLAAFSASSAMAMDITTSGAVEYRYQKDKIGIAGTQNPKLNRNKAEVKLAAEGASDGLGYGASVKIKTSDSVLNEKSKYVLFTGTTAGDPYSLANGRLFVNYKGAKAKANANVANNATGTATNVDLIGYTQEGIAVYAKTTVSGRASGTAIKKDEMVGIAEGTTVVKGKANISGYIQAGAKPTGDATGTKGVNATKSQTISNNALTQSSLWVSGAFGKVIVGQDGSAAGDNKVSGDVKAASYRYVYYAAKSAPDTTGSGERITYEAPEFVRGLKIAYTTTFKGNVDTDKTQSDKAPHSWAVAYEGDMGGVMVKVAHTSGTSASKNNAKTYTNTSTGINVTVDKFTVGYEVFDNGKKHHQTKGTSGTNYGVKYTHGDFAIAYSVLDAKDKNNYAVHSVKSSSADVISTSYTVAEGFSVYASRSSTSVKYTHDKKRPNFSHLIIGAKVSF